tara:strand:+ start:1281 stop:1445 length:165 start_codon:yes stop_codon:yes gene_type:complete
MKDNEKFACAGEYGGHFVGSKEEIQDWIINESIDIGSLTCYEVGDEVSISISFE